MKTNGINANALLSIMAYKGIKQKSLAEAAGVSRVTLNRIIQGKVSLTLETAQNVAEALEMTPEQFIEVFYNKKGEDA